MLLMVFVRSQLRRRGAAKRGKHVYCQDKLVITGKNTVCSQETKPILFENIYSPDNANRQTAAKRSILRNNC